MSEIKSEIEFILKQGRTIVDRKQVDNTTELTQSLDKLKLKYNELGAKVTSGKNELEKAFKYAKKFRKECNLIIDFLGKIDNELKKVEQKPLSKNYYDELDWIKNTQIEIAKVEKNIETLKSLHRSLVEFVKAKDNQLPTASNKIKNIEEKLRAIVKRLQDRQTFIESEVKLLDQKYQSYLNHVQQILSRIDNAHHQSIEFERDGNNESFSTEIDSELTSILSDIEVLKKEAIELCSQSDQYSKVVETELRSVLRNFDELNRRIRFIQVNKFFFLI